mmetsp:Transcript_39864/g.40375  ORF Transcript_39864/g.40375 Transcript_39864/m.40375 type:complete len:394 (+) Transcript_39864:26-1207(+)
MAKHRQIFLSRPIVSLGRKLNFCRSKSRDVTTVAASQHQLQPPYTHPVWIKPTYPRCNYTRGRRFISTYDDYEDNDNDFYNDGYDRHQQTALVVGSSGSLGRCLVDHLSKELKVRVIGADVVAPSNDDESQLTGGFIELPTTKTSTSTKLEPSSLSDLTIAMTDGLHQLIGDNQKLDAVICVAGAWEGDPQTVPPSPSHDEDNNLQRLWLLESARKYSETIDRMLSKNLYPVLAAGYASHHYMTAGAVDDDNNNGGLFVAIGATAALSGTPGMLGYGLSKVATHHFVQTIGETSGKAVTNKSKRKLARSLRIDSSSTYLNRLSVVGILPTTIDTPANRQAMPEADFKGWTKSIDIAKEIGLWMQQPALRPHSGSLVKVHPALRGDGAEFKVAR